MSLTQRVKQGFLRLPFSKKAVLVSSATLMVSTLLPWYDERNSFGIGDTYLGVQGPLFLVGVLVLGFASISFFNLFLPLMGRHFFNLRRKGGSVALLMGAQSLLLLAVANSVFYHPQFGLNLTSKGTRFGMMVALFAVGMMMISGWMTRRKEAGESEDLDLFVEPEVAEPVTMAAPMPAPMPSRPTVSPVFTPMPTPASAPQVQEAVDPLTLDAKTRYRMMQSQQRYSSNGHTNLWGGGNGSAYGAGSYGRRMASDSRDQTMDF